MSIADPYRTSGKLDGACLCGAVRITVDGDYIAAIGVCHCGICQRSNGVVWGAFQANADAVTVEGDVASYASTEFATRTFCPTCGSNLWLRDNEEGAVYELMPALFPDAAGFPVISEIYTDCAPSYAALAGDHRRATKAEYEAKNRHVTEGTA
ncbi:GFA family protein [Gymnodinialimonas hymeniacidonis]|uniref:GFA family protein n=1 Tax=Gymnodinialimonas hymeniacidonis TaxID=3126508 RepID=UPI0034C6D477